MVESSWRELVGQDTSASLRMHETLAPKPLKPYALSSDTDSYPLTPK